MAVVYWAPWCNCTSELHLSKIYSTAWNLGWGGKASDGRLISSSIPFKRKATCSSSVWAPRFGRWPLKVPFQTQPICEILILVGTRKTAPDTSAKERFLQSYKICFFVRNKIMSVLTDMALLSCKWAVLSSGYLQQHYRKAGPATVKFVSGLRGLCSPWRSEAFSPIFRSLSDFSKGQSLFCTLA